MAKPKKYRCPTDHVAGEKCGICGRSGIAEAARIAHAAALVAAAPSFTPGPWEVESGKYGNLAILAGGLTNYVAEVASFNTRQVADARLIAAAPELLDALYGVARETQSEVPGGCWCSAPFRGANPSFDVHGEACSAARAAIAKAVRA